MQVIMHKQFAFRIAMLLAAALWLFAGVIPSTFAADPEFVGVLALAIEETVAKGLGLSEDQKTKLIAVIDEREEKALELALSLKSVSRAERDAKLGPFRAESEKAGLSILTEVQQVLLEQMRLRKAGMLTLGEEKIAEKLNLTDEQKQKVTKALNIRASNLEKIEPKDVDKLNQINQYTESQLLKVLEAEQRATWEGLSGGPAGGVPNPAATAGQ